ncbi:Lactonase, 7-bladed beta-propeller-domain-containing protein [Fusarium flagelliforme]|uniref:Lactonase, 7-bladed beta-propeller-domain-containing protein n=1 Tax=Fusarium flagelliforme TaxID=2675880 RepID=UPI001E8CFAC5|nr:Lactonase, 7-bladed beta-propeller-domain-containing protein [Fusarium flagelliforme]KAH7183546.1 Lactonase, 7-bladed beta-propeller-domain-containing protein [Fusarium flagelliforme]
MHSKIVGVLLGSAALANAVNLFVADYSGKVTTLKLTEKTNGHDLTVASIAPECQPTPSWLTLDKANNVLYCLDRGPWQQPGSLNSFKIGTNGALKHVARVRAPSEGVAGEIVTGAKGKRGYFGASYIPGVAAAYELGNDGAISGSQPLQQISTKIDKIGPIADRQEASHLHHVIIDPTGKYVITPDLGGDVCRVWSFDKDKIAPIAEVGSLKAPAGSGPRHGFFKVMKSGETFFIFNGELDQKVYSYRVKYTRTSLSFTKVFKITSLNEKFPPNTAPISEIAMSPDGRFVVVSNREKSFATSIEARSGPSDTLTTFLINEDGTLKPVQAAPSGGYLPRQFSFNKAGDKIAVGHQVNQTVVIWKRDVQSGKIVTEAEGGKLGQVQLTGQVVATIWDE